MNILCTLNYIRILAKKENILMHKISFLRTGHELNTQLIYFCLTFIKAVCNFFYLRLVNEMLCTQVYYYIIFFKTRNDLFTTPIFKIVASIVTTVTVYYGTVSEFVELARTVYGISFSFGYMKTIVNFYFYLRYFDEISFTQFYNYIIILRSRNEIFTTLIYQVVASIVNTFYYGTVWEFVE